MVVVVVVVVVVTVLCDMMVMVVVVVVRWPCTSRPTSPPPTLLCASVDVDMWLVGAALLQRSWVDEKVDAVCMAV